MARNVREVLRELGWTEGFHLPVTNEENRRLEQKVEELIKFKAESIVKLEIANDRLNALKRHHKKLDAENGSNQLLTTALRRNLENEHLMLREVEVNKNKKEIDIKEMKMEINFLNSNTSKIKDEINSYTEKMNELRETLAWEEEALFVWEEELAKEDRTRSILENLKFQDQEKFNELELKRQALRVDWNQQVKMEMREMETIQTLETQLSKTSNLFKDATAEQQKLLAKWQEADKVEKDREKQIKLSDMFASKIKTMAREKYFELYEKRKLFHIVFEENRQLEKTINHYCTQYEKGKEITRDQLKTIQSIKQETDLCNRHILSASSKLDLQRAKNKELQNCIAAREAKINNLILNAAEYEKKIANTYIDTLTIEQQSRNTEDIYEMGQKLIKEENRELNRLQVDIVKLTEELELFKNKEKVLLNETRSLNLKKDEIQDRMKNINLEIKETETKTWQKEIQYMLYAKKYSKLVGKNMNMDVVKKLEEEELNIGKEIKELKQELGSFKYQMKNLRKELADMNIAVQQGNDELEKLKEMENNSNLILSRGRKKLEEAQDDYSKKQLDFNMIKMQESLAKEKLAKHEEELCMLQKQKIHMESAIQERNSEIKHKKNVILVKRKALIEEKGTLKKTIDHIKTRVKQLQNRYDLVSDILGKTDGGEQISVAHYKLKLAQEKHELQEQGDELDAKINKTEKEILALENTLRVVSSTNEQYKNNLDTIDIEGPKMKEYEKLEKKYFEMNEQCKIYEKTLQDVDSEIRKINIKIQTLQENGLKMQHDWKVREQEVENLTKDLSKKQLVLSRATRILKKFMKEVKQSKEPEVYKNLALKDIDIRMAVERNKSALQQLADFAANYIEAAPIVERLLQAKNICLPHAVRCRSVETSEINSIRSVGESRISMDGEISISPSVIHLDPTILLPDKYRPKFS